jgi:non-ribosomal peptide synthetase-like protein
VTLERSGLASEADTLVSIFGATVADHPEALALDNGAEMLTYSEFEVSARVLAAELARLGIGRGDRVGVRVASGTVGLYVAIMGTLMTGAAYVPVDADDPDERARTVFGEAEVAAVIGNDLAVAVRGGSRDPRVPFPQVGPGDDAWIIFTSGSTGTPKGVAVTHASASAFVEAEARIYLQQDPIGPADRVMAGLSVAFDASCEEMWLAWRHGACLVPAPRSVVRSGVDLGPWLVANRVTVVSTVPTLLLLWPAASLDRVRLLILGGEACPPEIGARFDRPGREVWNTYGPTEATVVACAALVRAGEPVRIGLPLNGWDLAVVDAAGHPVAVGERGELIIGGVGLARYLDPAKDAEKFAPMSTLGWERAYRSGDVVLNDPAGLIFVGRGDDQVKVGGRRIELGELDAALLALPGVTAAAAAVRSTASGTRVLVGYLNVTAGFDKVAAAAALRRDLPAALVPRLAVVDAIPTRTSGKVDRDALPWPLPSEETAATGGLTDAEAWLAEQWVAVLGAEVRAASLDFFDLGGSSLTSAHLVARLRERYPEAAVADVYDHPTLAGLAAHLDSMDAPSAPRNDDVGLVGRRSQLVQLATLIPLRTIGGLRWVTYLATGSTAAAASGLVQAPTAPWPALAIGWLLLVLPPGRMLLAAGAARLLLAGLRPGRYSRGGGVHLRLWAAERVAEELLAQSSTGSMWIKWFGRLLGARIGADVDLHTVPPITGLLSIGDGASIEFEVDLAGYWIDGDELTVGRIDIGPDARIGVRSTLGPGTIIGAGAQVIAGSSVQGPVPAGACWSGSPAARVGAARGPWQPTRPPRKPAWAVAYTLASLGIGGVPVLGVLTGLALVWWTLPRGSSLTWALLHALAWTPLAALAGGAVMAGAVLGAVRLLGLQIRPGAHPVQSLPGWAAWSTFRLLDEVRTWLFPLYSGWFTPTWLRWLGADIGSGTEASTVVLIPSLSKVGDGSFLADDTMLGGYELGGGWLRVEHVQIGKHAFLGNSGMAAPGRKVPTGGLVAVLSAAPRRDQAKKRTSWLGSPPELLRRTAKPVDATLTYAPPRRLRVLRGVVEAFRAVPVVLSAELGVLAGGVLLGLAETSWWLALAASGVVLAVLGIVAGLIASLAKAALVGRVRTDEHPLWTPFVWRSELADAFVECLAVGWLVRWSIGTPLLNAWLRTLGAQVGRGVWCETYWLPEPDLVELRDGATVNSGCVVQTHLFHDRVLSLGGVVLGRGATLGPNSVILPGATIGRHATIGPASLVMRGESVPPHTRWIGNPIGPWQAPPAASEGEPGYGDPS